MFTCRGYLLYVPVPYPFPTSRKYGRDPCDRRSLEVSKSIVLQGGFIQGEKKKNYLRSNTSVLTNLVISKPYLNWKSGREEGPPNSHPG